MARKRSGPREGTWEMCARGGLLPDRDGQGGAGVEPQTVIAALALLIEAVRLALEIVARKAERPRKKRSR